MIIGSTVFMYTLINFLILDMEGLAESVTNLALTSEPLDLTSLLDWEVEAQLDHLWLDDNWKYCFYVHTYKLFNT